jgi:hypothetical protein
MTHTTRIIILVVLIALVIGLLPTWTYSARWGWYPSAGAALLVLVLALIYVRWKI